MIAVRRQPAYEALRAARDREKTRDFMELYAHRAGIEGTVPEPRLLATSGYFDFDMAMTGRPLPTLAEVRQFSTEDPLMQFMLERIKPPSAAPAWCAICGRPDQPTALWGVPPSVELAGSTIVPPGSISICNDCARRHELEPDHQVTVSFTATIRQVTAGFTTKD